jgi:hypothetical protein
MIAPKSPEKFEYLQTNQYALCVLDSYLTASKIPHEVLPGEDGVDFRIQEKSSKRMVTVSIQVEKQPVSADLVVLVEDVMSLTLPRYTAFHSLTEPLGWGKPIPVDRGPAPEGKVYDTHLLVIRHREWRNAPDLPEQVLAEKYDRIIRFLARIVLRDPNRRAIVMHAGEDFDSLCLIGRIIAMNFHHKYRDLRNTEQFNRTAFGAHLKQRFRNALTLWRRQQESNLPDEQTVAIGLTRDVNGSLESFDPAKQESENNENNENKEYLLGLAPWAVVRLPWQLKKVRDGMLKQRAIRAGQGSLDTQLGTIHSERMQLLMEVAGRESRYVDADAKALAREKVSMEMTRCLDHECIYHCAQVLGDLESRAQPAAYPR